ncbi:SIR2 family protein [Pedobacter antarcticus]|uniref:SIR2 family protein n=1 Tax=Pedobacter antarcticus TaxID=34086 RepID=UPI002930D337|nr:SIR2 family protein [Pedobacter antarcticus]
MLEETLTKEELEANTRRKYSLIDFIESGDSILMAGAGCSGMLYPAWPDFVAALEAAALAHAPDFKGDPKDFLDFADKVKDCLGDDKYYAFIYKTFKPGATTHEQFHEILCRLPFKGITTTNYDTILESALNVIAPAASHSLHFEGTTKAKIHEFLMSLNHNKNLPKRVAHLHGICGEDASIVLGGKEYSSKYGFSITNQKDTLYDKVKDGMVKEEFQSALIRYGYEWPLRRKLLWALLATRRIVFIGFSMTDPYFKKMLEFVKEDVGTYYSESHFLVLRVTKGNYKRSMDYSQRLKDDYGIETVFYFDEENDYGGLPKFIAELDVINEPKQVTSKIGEETLPLPKTGSSIVRDKLLAIAKKQNSDEN